MINRANIGVGLLGNEGREAASNSDYALSEFKHLRRLMFYHGYNFSYKMTYFVLLYLFRQSIFAFVPIFYSFNNGYSG
jgi:phospholipid-transporting ATPase